MIIHSYLTNGSPMFGFAELFLESFKYYHGENTKIVFSTRNLSNQQIKRLKRSYKNIDILNEKFDFDYLMKITKYSKEYLEKIKKQVESGMNISGKKDHVLMKQYISVEDRYRTSILDVISKYNPDHLLHLDIDICFNGDITPMVQIVKNNDFSFKTRNSLKGGRSIVGYALGFTINQKTMNFLNRWMEHIDKYSLDKKPKGYGQTSLLNAYNEMKREMKIGEFPVWMTANSQNHKNRKSILLSGNKRNKSWNIQYFKKIYKENL